jgi:ABC-type polysaccharide/polyol phosphate export permease
MFPELWKYRYVVLSYVSTSLRHRYRRSRLGFAWVVLTPMLQYAVIGMVMAVLSTNSLREFMPYYLAGAVFYALFSGIVGASPSVMIANERYIRKMAMPKLIYVLNLAGLELASFLFAGGALLAIGVGTGAVAVGPALLAVPVAVFLLVLFAVGIACIVSVISVYFRDVNHMVPVALQTLFFLTPVVYPERLLPEPLQLLLRWNPLYAFLQLFREPLLSGQWPAAPFWGVAVLCATSSFLVGVQVLQHFDNRIVFRL